MHVAANDEPFAVRGEGDVRLQLVIVFREVNQFLVFEAPNFDGLAVYHLSFEAGLRAEKVNPLPVGRWIESATEAVGLGGSALKVPIRSVSSVG